MDKDLRSLLFILFVFTTSLTLSQTRLSDVPDRGSWQDTTSWANGYPECGDSVIIQAGDTVIVNQHIELDETSTPPCSTAMYIEVRGTLFFQTGKKIYLACGSAVYVADGGYLSEGSGGGASNIIDVCGSTIWQASDGPITGPQWVGAPLPIKLKYTSARIEDGKALIEWSSLSELNNDYYTIEKSYDLNEIETVGIVIGAGNSNKEINYNFVDPELKEGVTYYRLRQTDYNGSSETFDWMSVNSTRSSLNNEHFKVFGHDSKLYIDITGLNEELVTYQLLDLTGRVFQEGEFVASEGSTVLDFISPLKGILIVKLSSRQHVESFKVILD